MALDLFNDLTTQMGLHFLIAYPSQTAAQQLPFADFAAFCEQQHYSHPGLVPTRYAHLQRAVAQPAPDAIIAYQEQIPILAALLLNFVQQKRQAIRRVQTLFAAHPDQEIFASLPGAGELLAPKLLVMFGDHRQRFPTAAAIQTLAGTCPVTVQSGKKKHVHFRRACNHEYRHTAQQFAITSPSPRYANQPGPLPISIRPKPAACPKIRRIVVWPTAGWPSFGHSGKEGSSMTKPTICNRCVNIVARDKQDGFVSFLLMCS